jgi:hypothetical protein
MEQFDFSTPAGWQKFWTYVIGTAATILVAFGVSQAKVDSMVSVAAMAVPVILTITSLIFNQLAATGKAKTELKKMEIAAGIPVDEDSIIPPKEEEVEIPVSIPTEKEFDVQGFMDEVNKTTAAAYTVVNPATTFYNAERLLSGFVKSENEWKGAKLQMFKLVEDYFKSIWGCSWKEANDFLNDPLGRGCPTCTDVSSRGCTYPNLKYKAMQLGEGYYKAYLEYDSAISKY